MGRQIAPEDPLFADSRGLAGAGKVVDLNLEGGQNRVDFDLLGEPSPRTRATQEAVELDLGAALGEPTATRPPVRLRSSAQTAKISCSMRMIIRMPPARRARCPRPSPDATTDMTALRPVPLGVGSTETMRIDAGGEPESPTVEQPAASQRRSGAASETQRAHRRRADRGARDR